MTFVNKYRELVERLHEETSAGRVKWRIDSWQAHPIADFSGYSIRLSHKEEDEEPFEVIEILKEEDETSIDTFDDSIFRNMEPRVSGADNYYLLMKSLRQTATRVATGADGALDEILKALDRQKAD